MAAMLQEEVSSDDGQDWSHGLTKLPNKGLPSQAATSPKASKAKAAAAKVPPKAKARPGPVVQALNPLPQRAAQTAATGMLNGGLEATSSSLNAATSAKWVERPVEKIDFTQTYEEEEDPELACYIWDRKAQRPKKDQRAAPAQGPNFSDAPPLSAARPAARAPTAAPARQRFLLSKVVELGFDEQQAKRALAQTNWVGLEEAVNVLLS